MAEQRSTEVVPGMAEAIEARRKELRLRPGRFAQAAGVTTQGLVAVRKGYRRQYQDKVKLGVAAALQWPSDAVDRLMDGEDPATFGAEPRDVPTVEQAIAADPDLTDQIKDVMVAFYRSALEQSRKAE